MKHWPTKLLGELCDVEGGNAAPQGDENYKDGTIPFVRMKDLGRPHFTTNLTETDDKLTEASATAKRMKFFEPGCILFPRSGSVALNHRAILGIRACIVSHIGVLQNLRPEITPGFLYLYLTTFDMTALSKKTTGVDSIAFADVKKIPVPVPPFAEQERIVKLLDETDVLRKLRAQADHRTANLVPALFYEMFGDSDSNPKGWPIKTLEQLAERLHQGINTAADKVQYQANGYPILQSKHITSGRMEIGDARFVSEADFAKYKDRYRPSVGNILFTNIGTIGKSVIIEQNTDLLVAWNIFLIALKSDVLPIFVNAFLQLLDGRGYFTGRNTGTATQFVSKSQMQAIKIPVPPLPLQKEFAQRVTEIRELEASQATSRTHLDALFQSMLHRAFNGEL